MVKPRKVKDKTAQHYVDNKEFLKHMKVYIKEVRKAKRNKEPRPQPNEYIGECILRIANKLANRPNFINYPFRDEMISDGIENCLMYIGNFNPAKSNNPFAYFTQIIYFAFIRRIQREKKYLYTKYKCISEILTHDISESEHLQIKKYGSEYSDNFMHEFVENFEKTKDEKKRPPKKKKKPKVTLDAFLE